MALPIVSPVVSCRPLCPPWQAKLIDGITHRRRHGLPRADPAAVARGDFQIGGTATLSGKLAFDVLDGYGGLWFRFGSGVSVAGKS